MIDKWCLVERISDFSHKPYYNVKGKVSVDKLNKNIHKPARYILYDSEDEMNKAIEILKDDGFRIIYC